MKKTALLIFMILLLVHCDEVLEKFNYIEVTVTGKVGVVYFDVATNTIHADDPISGTPVKMSLIKAGGERVEDTGITDAYGGTSITGTFNLYKEQPIAFKAIMEEEPFSYDSKQLTWDEVEGFATGDGIKTPRKASKTMYIELLVDK